METNKYPLDTLTAPIPPELLEWRVQQQTKTGKLIVVPYITNRCVMERFDKQFGWHGWQSSFREIADGFICTLTVTLPDGTRVSKEDGATRTDIEPVKGGISDAMKRCAVQFGIGRSLYNYPRVFIETPDKYVPRWAESQLEHLVKKINDGTYKGGAMVTLKESYNR